ncbi:uncharacterized protein LOC126564492 [Anopheles maculipalpis]|uniref:uncharacterized protein LOC126564492 n=1 Tax=Anopheles maculipalpis TaxID=1496333 RepID=UPI002159A1D1|nr:uncharacterized protein LOC126564492 [Anopheles maculipalpis]
MECRDFVSREPYRSEKELLKSIKKKQKYSLENNLSNCKALLRRQVGRNGDNLYDLLTRLVSNLLDTTPPDAVDHFEEYCRLSKIDFLSPDRRFLHSFEQHKKNDCTVQKQALLAKKTLTALAAVENENVCYHSKLRLFVQNGLNTMGLDLPRGYDYFISAQIAQTLRNNPNATSCEFWGIVRTMTSAYYVLEANLRDKSVEYCQYQGVIGKHPEIITDIIDTVLEKTLHQTRSLSILPKLTAESLENLAQTMVNELLAKLQLVDKEIEEQYCRLDIASLLTVLIERLPCISSAGSSEESFSAMLTDPCASSRSSVQSTASMLRIRLERIQLETRLNSRKYWVCENPRTKPWQELPDTSLEQLEASEGLRIFLRGNLEASVPHIVKKFYGVEKNLLRAIICKISSHRDCHIDGSETNISLVRCLSGMYFFGTGYSQELLQERAERWCERKEQGMQYWQSETWPGLCTFNDGEQFRCYYSGWGMERGNNWYCPIVRVPKMACEYEDTPARNSDISQRSNEENNIGDVLSKISSRDSLE